MSVPKYTFRNARTSIILIFTFLLLLFACRYFNLLSFDLLLKAFMYQLALYFSPLMQFIIHSTHYLFSDWPKAYSEFSKIRNKIIMWTKLKVTGNNVMFDRSSWFLRVLSVACWFVHFYTLRNKLSIQLFFVQCIIKQILESVFVISRIIKVDLDYSGYHKNLVQQLFSNNHLKKWFDFSYSPTDVITWIQQMTFKSPQNYVM